LWLFRETLAKAGLIERLFERFGQHLEAQGYIARGGQMVDATIVPVPKQRNSRDENDDVEVSKTPGSACAWHPHSRGSLAAETLAVLLVRRDRRECA
jgi:hypothetical protein